jgi:adenosylcobinamide-phosphate synthase
MWRAFTILAALSLDLAFGDPPNRFHPLLLMGRWLNWGRGLAPPNYRFWFGAGWTLAGLGLFILPVWKMDAKRGRWSIERCKKFILPAFFLKLVLAYRDLRRAVVRVARTLAWNDLEEARRLLSWHLVSRNTGELTPAEVAGAAIESLAENLTDSLTAPLLAYAIGLIASSTPLMLCGAIAARSLSN